MSDKKQGPPQLERDLILRLMLPVLIIVGLTGLLGAYGAQLLVDRVFDRWLIDAAYSLAEQVRFERGFANIELSRQAEALLVYDVIDRTYFEVVQGNKHLIGQWNLPASGQREKRYADGASAYDATFDGKDVRVVKVPVFNPEESRVSSGVRDRVRLAMGNAHVTAYVAETTAKRKRAQRDLMLMMTPIGILVLAAALAVGIAVRRTIAPLQRIAARWNERSHASLSPIPSDDVPGELLPFAHALNDLLSRVRTMMERERQFAATAAHQLRTPLAGLQLGLARAAEAPDLATARAVIREMGTTTQRTARLVQQLLALSRLDPEVQGGVQFSSVDLIALTQEVGETYVDAAQNRHIELELVACVPSIRVRAQPELLAEALGNLIDNAVRHTPIGGHILIEVKEHPPAIVVSDSGPGMSADERNCAFERFVRGKSAIGGGSGLGLAIVKEIGDLHGAEISLGASEWGGLRVSFDFPSASGSVGRPSADLGSR